MTSYVEKIVQEPSVFSALGTGAQSLAINIPLDLPWRSIYVGACLFGLTQALYTGRIKMSCESKTPDLPTDDIVFDHGGYSSSLVGLYSPGRLLPQREVEIQYTAAVAALNFVYEPQTIPDSLVFRRRWTDGTAPNTVIDKTLELFPIRLHSRINRIRFDFEYQGNLETGFTNTGYMIILACKSGSEKF